MQWTRDKLESLTNLINKKYFNNEVTKPITFRWSRHLFNSGTSLGNEGAEAITRSSSRRPDHIITINVSLYHATYELMKNVIAHEMIHCWQFEHDKTWASSYNQDGMHNPVFFDWVSKLNNTGDFKYPLAKCALSGEDKDYNKTKNNSGYFVYKIATTDDGTEFPLGFFIKFIYADEATWLKNRGFKVRMCKNLKVKSTCDNISLIQSNDFTPYFLTITFIKQNKLTAENGIRWLVSNGKRQYIFCDDDFNFESSIEIK